MWFRKKKSPPAAPAAPAPARAAAVPPPAPKAASARSETTSSQTIQQLERRLKKLEEELSQLSAKHPQIHIDNVHIHQPVLDNLTFRLDALDIKELSGSLNLGNNFGTKPAEKSVPGREGLRREPRTAADGAPSTAEHERKAQRETEPGLRHEAEQETDLGIQPGPSREYAPGRQPEPGPAAERTATGYRFTPQSKTK
ncbi:hypothetical protein ACFPES_05470 [Paenibacillus sp. GCM10023248]|uniref:hypothetical protein n=1 Tax=unclassified Paenibacillus TaxID=185978 RepID=UPI002378AB95|nr:hypothetical protein [Paenibacillus sp. MAHUQ-63]MDD9266480.1 hypothetical protein [Paenibacillus sp. MAHUQ-63]